MKIFRRRQQGDVAPDLTSFSDIANLLIIFFILTTSLVRPFGRQMEMPSSAKPPEEKRQSEDTLSIRLSPESVRLSRGENNERTVTMNELRAELLKCNFPALPPDKRAVVVESTPETNYERYYSVATAIAAAGGVVAVMTE